MSILFKQAVCAFHEKAVNVGTFVVAAVTAFAIDIAHFAHALQLYIRRVANHGIEAHESTLVIEDFGEFEHPFERVRKVNGSVRLVRVFLEHFERAVFDHAALEACDFLAEHHLRILRSAGLVFLHVIAVFDERCFQAVFFAVALFFGTQVVGNHVAVLHGVFGEQAVADLDVDVDIRERFEPRVSAFGGVVGVFQEFNPQTQTADVYGVRIQIHAEKAIFDDVLFLVE